MKIILSRKGFDSASGGSPSPLVDGTLVPLPIPYRGDPHTYEMVTINGHRLGQMVEDLTGCRIRKSDNCHFDPDLDSRSLLPLRRAAGWRPAFGQTDAAQSHLARHGIGKGDLFLFFGWFREAERANGVWRFVRGAPNLHVIYGWMQINDVIPLPHGSRATGRLKPFAGHPHLNSRYRGSNTLYVGANHASVAGLTGPGGGVFKKISPSRILTDTSQSKRSVWKLPGWVHPTRGTILSYHGSPQRWRVDRQQCVVNTVGRGQEFILTTPHLKQSCTWLQDVFNG
jgi:hypothetical protein